MPEHSSPSPSSSGRAAGLEGIVVASSTLCFIDGQKGELVYRGYDINELAGHASFEEIAWLLWTGELPDRRQLATLQAQLRQERFVPAEVDALLRALPPSTTAMEALRTGVSALSAFDAEADEMSEAANRRKAIRLTAKLPTLLAAHLRLGRGKEPVAADDDLGHAANLLWMLHGARPSKTAARAMDLALVLHAEHGFNASTFAARVTAATLADLHSAVVSAISTLKGPLHGGANRAVMRFLEQIGELDRVEAAVMEKLARKERVMGFGHRVYKTMDPRAVHLKRLAADLGRDTGESKWFEMSARMEEVMRAQKGLDPNVDFYSAAAYRSLGIPTDAYPAIFACSRISGWTAHILEQYADNRLIRPRAQYVGPRGKAFAPLDERGRA